MAYLFGAYLVLWGVTFGYIFYLGGRQKRLQRELEQLNQKAAPAPASSAPEGERAGGS
jgi:CcmD family protein